ncbi:MAG: LIC_12616 family protein [Lacrimispora sphenoides]
MKHYLTMTEVEDLMLNAVRLILNIPDDNKTVRLAYGADSKTGSAPMHDPKDMVCYVMVNPTDDGYGKQHHIHYEEGDKGDLLAEVDEYTEEYAVIVSCYGDESHELSRKIRDGLYGEAAKRLFHSKKFHFVVGTPQLIQTRDIVNSSWVRRCDFTANFYAYVRVERPNSVNWIENVNIQLKTSNEQQNDPQTEE